MGNFSDLLQLIGSLSLVVFGIKLIGDGSQKITGKIFRSFHGMVSNGNRFTALFAGFSITALMQSSSAATVTVVSFVNSGLISLYESISVILGANIGKTISAWLVALLGFNGSNYTFSLALIAISSPLLLGRKKTWGSVGEIFTGFGIMFIGIELLKMMISNQNDLELIRAYTQAHNDFSFANLGLFILIGILLSSFVQSSAAAISLTLTLLYYQLIPIELAGAMVVGENIGTTLTANWAALSANIHAKRAAFSHLLINFFGLLWVFTIFEPFVKIIQSFTQGFLPQSIISNKPLFEIVQLVFFHSSFNLINAFVLIGFIPPFAQLISKILPSKSDSDEETTLTFLGEGVLQSADLSIFEAKAEILKFGKLTYRMFKDIEKLLDSPGELKENTLLHETLSRAEYQTDIYERNIGSFLTNLNKSELSTDASIKIKNLLNLIHELERIGDILDQLSMSIKLKNEEKVWFSPEQWKGVNTILTHLNSAFENMLENLGNSEDFEMQKTQRIENTINYTRNNLRLAHYESLKNKEYDQKSGVYYQTIFASCERVADHIYNVSDFLHSKI